MSAIVLSDAPADGATTAWLLTAQLAKAELPFERRAFPWDPKQIHLHFPSGAALGLTEDADFFAPGTVSGPHRLFCFTVQAAQGGEEP